MASLSTTRGDGGVVRITMDRPEVHNAFDEAMVAAVEEAFAGASADPQARVIVLAGRGRNFCAGADIQWMKRQGEATVEANLEDARRFAAMLHRIATSPKPTVAAVQGACMGGGVGLACACDFTIAAQDARFSVSEARFGILPSVIGPYLIAAVGVRQAKRLALSAERIDAPEALRIGLAHQVVAAESLAPAVDALLAQLRESAPGAIAEVKALYSRLGALGIGEEARELTAATIARVRGTGEAREGFAAFLEKRKARWTI
ncbi:MAG TPA: enoyl-CoA hydratase-related protein [Usitatibacter sp.]|nr:enoyl-CoA hydratase-related protein [Usitatibacter sp.]